MLFHSSVKRSGFFNRAEAGISASGYIKERTEKIEAEHTSTDASGRKYIDTLSPGYHSEMAKMIQDAVPDTKQSSGKGMDDIWTMPASSRNAALEAKPGSYQAEILYRNTDTDGYKNAILAQRGPAGSTGRYVTLRHGDETSGYLMEVEPDGDIHRFLDLECPDGEAMLLELPQGSYTVEQEWESSPLIQHGVENVRKFMNQAYTIPSFTPPGTGINLYERFGTPLVIAGKESAQQPAVLMASPFDSMKRDEYDRAAAAFGFESDWPKAENAVKVSFDKMFETPAGVEPQTRSDPDQSAPERAGRSPFKIPMPDFKAGLGKPGPDAMRRNLIDAASFRSVPPYATSPAASTEPDHNRMFDGDFDGAQDRELVAKELRQAEEMARRGRPAGGPSVPEGQSLTAPDTHGELGYKVPPITENEFQSRLEHFISSLANDMNLTSEEALQKTQATCGEKLAELQNDRGPAGLDDGKGSDKQPAPSAPVTPPMSPTERMMEMDRERWGGGSDGPGDGSVGFPGT